MTISTAPEVEDLIAANAPMVICVSGGKDSRHAATESVAHARSNGHTGQIVLCYSDLGRVVWSDAKEQCQMLADKLGVELVIVRREAGGLMERWQKRWADNVERYVNLSCVKVILPWSTPAMRFCTSELKTTIIQRWIRKTFNEPVICVLGIRRDESRHRAKAPIFKPYQITIKDGKEKMPALPVGSVDWHPIVEVKTEMVFQILRASEMPMPSSYGFDADRFSCAFCMMATLRNLRAGTRDPRNHDLYREQCELEIVSTFSFQDSQWLSDVAPELLTEDQRQRLPLAKAAAKLREQIESVIPKHLLYVKGWPVVMPTMPEAQMLADIRKRTGEIMGLPVKYTTALEVWNRYDELMRLNEERQSKKRKKAA
jgi:3'-phosphoadenosine 5'-phosphosulfate sulfotransferase (PAPS reductase)/FAD synthetase